MNEIFVSYHPGSMGNFIKMLIASGIDGNKLLKNHVVNGDETIYILVDSGEVLPYIKQSPFDRFLDRFYNNFSETWARCADDIFDIVCRVYKKELKASDNEIINGGHLHNSMHTNI